MKYLYYDTYDTGTTCQNKGFLHAYLVLPHMNRKRAFPILRVNDIFSVTIYINAATPNCKVNNCLLKRPALLTYVVRLIFIFCRLNLPKMYLNIEKDEPQKIVHGVENVPKLVGSG